MAYLRILIFATLIFSCDKNIDCNLDLEYIDGITYFKGKPFNGNCKSYYESGSIMNDQTYLNGEDNGTWYFYFKNGKIETTANFLFNKRHGKWIYYFDDGKTIRQISFYKNGLKDSLWINYKGDQSFNWTKKFKNDSLLEEKYYK